MKLFDTKKKRRILIPVLSVLLFLVICVIVFAIYVSDYYKAQESEIEAFRPKMTTEVYEKEYIRVGNEKSEIGFIFYPGGKVECTAYLPLMRELANEGVFSVLLKMPFNLAVFDANAAEDVIDEFFDVKEWYVGGHSLGGSMAASFLSKNPGSARGLVLLGSYSAADLGESDAAVISIYGSEDGVMNREKYEKNKENLPKDFYEIVIEGGNHAYFGMYGEQEGDGKAVISPEEQILFTAEHILNVIYEKDGSY